MYKKKQKILLAIMLCLSGGIHAQDESSTLTVDAKPLNELVINQSQLAPARVLAANRADVAAQVAAQIISIKVDVGDQVKKDDVLAQLDKRDYELALAQAQATLKSIDARIDQAKYRLKRANELSDSQYISDDDLLARQTDVTVLTAERAAQQVAIRIAKNNLARTKVIAPFDAVVADRVAQQGSYVVTATPMFTLVQLDQREVEARVATDLVDGAQNGGNLFFVRGDRKWPLELLRVTPVVESESGTQRIRLKFAGEEAAIGSSGQFSWSDGKNLLPADMIIQRGDSLGVFYVDDNVARFLALPNAQEGRPAAVELPGSALIVTNGRFKLRDGQKLKVIVR